MVDFLITVLLPFLLFLCYDYVSDREDFFSKNSSSGFAKFICIGTAVVLSIVGFISIKAASNNSEYIEKHADYYQMYEENEAKKAEEKEKVQEAEKEKRRNRRFY